MMDIDVEQLARASLNTPLDKARLIAGAIDRARRDAVQRRNAARGEVTEAYYEGMRVGLSEMQAFAEKVTAI